MLSFLPLHSNVLASPPSSYSSSNASPSEGAPSAGSYGCTPQSLPKFWHPSHELLRDNGFTQQGYHKYRRRCLNGEQTKWFTQNVAWSLLVEEELSDGFQFQFVCAIKSCICTWWSLFSLVTESMCFREEAAGHWPVSGDEHSVQVLVLLPERQLQQEDVWGVQTVLAGRRQRKQQVRRRRLNGAGQFGKLYPWKSGIFANH